MSMFNLSMLRRLALAASSARSGGANAAAQPAPCAPEAASALRKPMARSASRQRKSLGRNRDGGCGAGGWRSPGDRSGPSSAAAGS